MDRDELVEREYKQLDSIAKDYVSRVEQVLSSIRNEPVKLWLQKPDQYRLLTLRAWEIKYKISTKILLQLILPYWEAFVQRRSRKMKKSGLNVRVSTLTGKKSELILRDQLLKVYPNRENVLLWIAERKEELVQSYIKRLDKIAKKQSDGVRSRSDPSASKAGTLNLTDFSTPDQYVKYYRKYMKREQLMRETIEEELKQYAFRDNPFRPEFL